MATHDFGGKGYYSSNGTDFTDFGTLIIKDDGGEETTKQIALPTIEMNDDLIVPKMPGTQELGITKLSVQYAKGNYEILRDFKRARTMLHWKFENIDGDVWGPVQGFICRITRPKQGDDDRQMFDVDICETPEADPNAYPFTPSA